MPKKFNKRLKNDLRNYCRRVQKDYNNEGGIGAFVKIEIFFWSQSRNAAIVVAYDSRKPRPDFPLLPNELIWLNYSGMGYYKIHILANKVYSLMVLEEKANEIRNTK